jgi:hypothetical protein
MDTKHSYLIGDRRRGLIGVRNIELEGSIGVFHIEKEGLLVFMLYSCNYSCNYPK